MMPTEEMQRMMDWLTDVRIEGIKRQTLPVLREAREQGCGVVLTLAGGWFLSAVVSPEVPLGKLHLVQKS